MTIIGNASKRYPNSEGVDEALRKIAENHISNTANPHQATASQTGAAEKVHSHDIVNAISSGRVDLLTCTEIQNDAQGYGNYNVTSNTIESTTLFDENGDIYINVKGSVQIKMVVDSDYCRVWLNGRERVYTSGQVLEYEGEIDSLRLNFVNGEVGFETFTAQGKSGFMSPEMLRMLDEASKSVEGLGKRVDTLEVPAQAEDEVTLQRLYEEGKVTLEDATLLDSAFVLNALSSTVTINAGGYTEFEFVSSGEFLGVIVDGSSVTRDMNGRFAYSGIVNEGIIINGGPATVNVSRYSSSGIYTGGILSPELSEKLHKTSVFTSEEKKKLAETSVFTSAEKAIVNNVGAITDASVTTVRAVLPSLVANGIIKIDADSNTNIGNTSISGGNLVTITVGAYCSFDVRRTTSETTKVYVDGVEVPIGTIFRGYADVITITDDTSISLNIAAMTVYTYKGGYITSEQLKDFDRIRTEINKLKVDYNLIDEAFNEIYEYAEEIIGGDFE